jgi:hypothetical protein
MTDPVITGTADVPAGDKHMDIAEFRAFGYLQEVNRQWLHPHQGVCGLPGTVWVVGSHCEIDDSGVEPELTGARELANTR